MRPPTGRGGLPACGETHAAFGRRSIPAEPPVMKPARRSAGDPSRLNRVAARRSSLRFGRNTPGIPPSRALSAGRLAPTGRTGQPRRSRGFHHRLLTASLRAAHRCVSVEIHPVFLPHAPCQPDPHRENWASPPPGGLASLGAHPGSTTGCYGAARGRAGIIAAGLSSILSSPGAAGDPEVCPGPRPALG